MAHALPSRDLAEVHLRAMRAFVAELKKRKYAVHRRHPEYRDEPQPQEPRQRNERDTIEASAASKDAEGRESSSECDELHSTHSSNASRSSQPERGRHIPAAVRRAVFERDGGRCAYLDDRGERCRETARLEFHHHEPFAIGGRHDTENLSLRCAQHNALAAEQDFGRASVIAKRDERPHSTWRVESQFTDDG